MRKKTLQLYKENKTKKARKTIMKLKRIDLTQEAPFTAKNSVTPYMDLYLLNGDKYDHPGEKRPKRPMVLICPGGGYSFLSEREAEPVALKYLQRGYQVGVVYYSIAPYAYPQAFLDLAGAICHVRRHADEYHIDPHKIAVCGFSAGGHLAASLCTMWHEDFLAQTMGVDAALLKPDMGLLCYPVISSGLYAHAGSFDVLAGSDTKLREFLSLENHVSENTPPTYLWHTAPDTTVPVMNSLLYAEKLSKYGVTFEMHVYPRCNHGMSIAEKETASDWEGQIDHYIASWVSDSYRFMDYIWEELPSDGSRN